MAKTTTTTPKTRNKWLSSGIDREYERLEEVITGLNRSRLSYRSSTNWINYNHLRCRSERCQASVPELWRWVRCLRKTDVRRCRWVGGGLTLPAAVREGINCHRVAPLIHAGAARNRRRNCLWTFVALWTLYCARTGRNKHSSITMNCDVGGAGLGWIYLPFGYR